MKYYQYISLIAFLFVVSSSISQNNQAFNYQAVAHDAQFDTVLRNKSIIVDFYIGSDDSDPLNSYVYTEEHQLTTNNYGLFYAQIGIQNPSSFSNLNWKDNSYFLTVAINSQLVSTQPLLAVPYSIHSKTSSEANNSSKVNNLTVQSSVPSNAVFSDNQTLTLTTDSLIISNGNAIDISSFTNTDNQQLNLQGDSLYISNGNYVNLSSIGSNSTDQQNLSLIGDSILIDNGNGISLSSYLDNTDNQILNLQGDSLFISSGNVISLSSLSSDNDWTESGNNIYSTNSGNVAIGTTSPGAKFEVESSSTERTSQFIQDYSSSADKYGVFSLAQGGGSGKNIGIHGEAAFGNINKGIVGRAFGGSENWAGYFEEGDVKVSNTLVIGTVANNGGLQLVDGNQGNGKVLKSDGQGNAQWTSASNIFSDDQILSVSTDSLSISDGNAIALSSLNSPDNDWNINGNDMENINSGKIGIGTGPLVGKLNVYTDSNTERGIYVIDNTNSSSYKIGTYSMVSGGGSGDNNGGWFETSGNGFGENVGVGGQALGASSTRNIGVYGAASGNSSGNNWAGYFDHGDVNINNNLVIGSPSTNGGFKLVDGNQGLGKVLRSDAQGNARWVSIGALAAGVMVKPIYDSSSNGIVDNAELVNGFQVNTNVPSNADFTDNQTLSISTDSLVISNGNAIALGDISSSSNLSLNDLNDGFNDDVNGNLFISSNFSTSLNSDATENTAFGDNSLQNLISGSRNTSIGSNTLQTATTGNNNIAVGFDALKNTIVSDQTAVGVYALTNNTTGGQNNAFGAYSLESNTNGMKNNAFGYGTLNRNISGNDNSGFGHTALFYNTNGIQNTAFGSSSLQQNTTGNNNTSIGSHALEKNTTGIGNTAIGYIALQENTIASENTAIGQNNMSNNTTGSQNTSVGSGSLSANTIGSGNVALGLNSMYRNIDGAGNTAVGYGSLFKNTNGSQNVSIGENSLESNLGSQNTSIGTSAGKNQTNSNQNTFIGYNANLDSAAASNGVNNSTAIGSNTKVGKNNSIILGNNASVGIGTSQHGHNSGAERYLTISSGSGALSSSSEATSLELIGGTSNGTLQNRIDFIARATDNNNYTTGRIEMTGSNDLSGSTKYGIMKFHTKAREAGGNNALTERMSIDNYGEITFGNSNNSYSFPTSRGVDGQALTMSHSTPGQLEWKTIESEINTANGITEVNSNIEIGGSLSKNTNLDIGAKSLNFRSSLTESLDQSQLTQGLGAGGSDNSTYWQAFQAGMDGDLTAIQIYFFTSYGENTTINVYDGTGTSGSILATGTITKSSSVIWYLDNSVTISTGSSYTFSIADGSGLRFGSANYVGASNFSGGSYDMKFQTFVSNTSSLTSVLKINGSSNQIGIGTSNPDKTLSVHGDASKVGGGSWATFSDKRLKKDIKEFNDGLDVIMKINPKTFKYNGLGGYPENGREYIGVIAQEMKIIAPYTIDTISKKINPNDNENSDLLMYDPSSVTYILINAIKEQQKMIESLQEELKSIKNDK